MTTYKSKLYAWMRGQGMAPRGTVYRILGFLAVYALLVAYIPNYAKFFESGFVDDIYAITGGAVGLWFTAYVAFVMSRWYDLAIATGTVSGCLTDIAMVMKSYLVQIDSKNLPRKEMAELIERLKIAHAYHVCELCGADRYRAAKSVAELFPETEIKHSGGLIPMLASILSLVTLVSEKLKFSDSVKFSLLPAVQQNVSTVRSRAGECCMILACRYPPVFTKCMYMFLMVHLGYLPIFLSARTAATAAALTTWSPAVSLVSLLGGALIISLAVIAETHFRNPFKTNDFKLDQIVAFTFSVIDDVLNI